MKLLLIEDDAVIVNQLNLELERAGFSLDICMDGQDGLYRAREFNYDLLIVDIGLPLISGTEIIQQLRAENNQVPILMLTARGSWQDKVFGLKSGADDYLVKPFQKEELVARNPCASAQSWWLRQQFDYSWSAGNGYGQPRSQIGRNVVKFNRV